MEQTASNLVRGITDFENHQRWYEFNNLYRPMIRKILHDKGLRPDELDDLVQEVYLSMLSTIERFKYDRTRGKFRSWLSTLTQRAVYAHRRKRIEPAVDPWGLEETEPAGERLSVADDDRMQLCLKLARNRFDDQAWLPFYLRVIEQTPIEDVQRVTGLNRNAIYQAVHRVKQCLREMLAELDCKGDDE